MAIYGKLFLMLFNLKMPRQLHSMFAYLLLYCNVESGLDLWEEFKQHLCEDLLWQGRSAVTCRAAKAYGVMYKSTRDLEMKMYYQKEWICCNHKGDWGSQEKPRLDWQEKDASSRGWALFNQEIQDTLTNWAPEVLSILQKDGVTTGVTTGAIIRHYPKGTPPLMRATFTSFL